MAAELDPPDAVEQSILRSLRRIQQVIGAQRRRVVERFEITVSQLLCLKELGVLGTTTPSALARRIGVSHATVTGMIDRLEGRGLVKRSRSSVDKRNVMLDLTARGRTLEATAPLSVEERLAAGLARRSPRWCATLDLALAELVEMMGDLERRPAPPLLGADEAEGTDALPVRARVRDRERRRNEPQEDDTDDHGEPARKDP